CFVDNTFVFYLPLILYNAYSDFSLYGLLALVLISLNLSAINLFLSIVSLYFSIMEEKFRYLLKKNRSIRDTLIEDTLYLRNYSEKLQKNKEKDIRIAILTERNRI